MKIKNKIGILGVGNMGAAILEGLLRDRIVTSSNIAVYDKITAKASAFSKKWRVKKAASVRDLAEKVDILLLAVKPQDLAAAGEDLKRARRSLILISILAGTPIQKIRKFAGSRHRIIRAMPNLGAQVRKSVTAVTGTDGKALKLAEKIFSGCGSTVRLKEKYFDLVTAISGSGPAYFFYLAEILADFGIKKGLKRSDAEFLAVQTAAGAGLLAAASPYSPGELREKVTSKKGTTEAALKKLKSGKIESVFYRALDAALKRGREISRA